MKRLALLAFVVVAAGCGSNAKTLVTTVTHTVTTTVTQSTCNSADTKATFDVQPGSEGAGNIVYTLKLTNTSSTPCSLQITAFHLLDANGGSNPTTITPPGGAKVLAAGSSLSYNARFSPDVTGTGDNTSAGGQCQPTSATLRITLSDGGTVDAPISPPTSVCEQGSMQLTPA